MTKARGLMSQLGYRGSLGTGDYNPYAHPWTVCGDTQLKTFIANDATMDVPEAAGLACRRVAGRRVCVAECKPMHTTNDAEVGAKCGAGGPELVGTCTPNTCTCENGVSKTGEACTAHSANMCEKCNTNFTLIGNICYSNCSGCKVLEVTVMLAKKLKNLDFFSKSDPYFVLEFTGNEPQRTTVINNDLNSNWGKAGGNIPYPMFRYITYSKNDKVKKIEEKIEQIKKYESIENIENAMKNIELKKIFEKIKKIMKTFRIKKIAYPSFRFISKNPETDYLRITGYDGDILQDDFIGAHQNLFGHFDKAQKRNKARLEAVEKTIAEVQQKLDAEKTLIAKVQKKLDSEQKTLSDRKQKRGWKPKKKTRFKTISHLETKKKTRFRTKNT